VLGKDFEDQEETLAGSELVQAPTGCEAELDVSNAAVEVIERRKRKGAVLAAGEANDAEDDGDGGEDDAARAAAQAEEEAQPGLWFLCDECQKPIAPGKKRFDCTVCEDYVLCTKCFRVRRHPCKFVRRKVPERCTPPEDWVKDDKTEEVENELDEYFKLDYEDIIGGDLPTRFKYNKAEKNGFGLTAKDILEKSDEELNRLMPLKKLRTYRGESAALGGDDGRDDRWRKKKSESEQKGKSKGKGSDHRPKGKGKGKGKGKAVSDVSDTRLSAYGLGSADDGGGHKKRRKA